jgi:serine/threonine protein kinase
MMNKLKNPRIIRFYGICPEPDFYSIVMEYMPNGSLDKVLYSQKDLPWNPLRWQII